MPMERLDWRQEPWYVSRRMIGDPLWNSCKFPGEQSPTACRASKDRVETLYLDAERG